MKVLVFGTFDILHKGHLNFFKQAREHGDYLIAVVARDRTVKEIKGKPPIESEKERLKNVAKELLGEGKHEVELDQLSEVWDNNPEELGKYAEYNLHDARLTYKLFVKMFPNLEEMVRIVGLTHFDTGRMAFSQLVEWFIIKQTTNFNELILNKPKNDEVSERRRTRIKGGYVYDPTPGVYKDILPVSK